MSIIKVVQLAAAEETSFETIENSFLEAFRLHFIYLSAAGGLWRKRIMRKHTYICTHTSW